jgi:uncharacterized membrane protein YfcA
VAKSKAKAEVKQEVKIPLKWRAKWWIERKFQWTIVFVAQVGLAVLATVGIRFLLQPVDPILATIIGVSFVGCLFYMAYRSK